MTRGRRLLVVAWFAAIVLAVVLVARNRSAEGWEWGFRIAIGLLLLALGVMTEPLKGRMPEQRRRRTGDGLTLALLAVTATYLAIKVVQALGAGDLHTAGVLGLFCAGLGSAFLGLFRTIRRKRRSLDALLGWCHQEVEARRDWTREPAAEGAFSGLEPFEPVSAEQVYGGRLDKARVQELTDPVLAALPGIGPPELAVLRRFLAIPRLPGIGMDLARQIQADGIYRPEELAALDEERLQKYRGIGPVKARKLRAHLESLMDAASGTQPPPEG